MFRLYKIAVVVITVLGTATLAPAQQRTNSLALAWGTFVHQVQMAPGIDIPALLTLNFDGTLTVASGFEQGGVPGATGKIGPIHGVWQTTAPRTVGATSYFFTFDMNGVLTGYQRNRCSLKFARDFQSYQGTEVMETTPCDSPVTCPDPLDATTVWTPAPGMPPTGYVVSGKRVQWLPIGH